jgi:membrane fusion protein (multidrug efflux system)
MLDAPHSAMRRQLSSGRANGRCPVRSNEVGSREAASKEATSLRSFGWLVLVLSASACAHAAPPTRPAAVTEVGVLQLQSESVLLTSELPGRISAYESSEVRPQVSGVLQARLFTEGQMVKKGQTLYQIDPRLYRATLTQARANLHSALAANAAAQVKAQRYAPLAEEHAVSELDYAEAKAAASQASAGVEQARAALETATINLRFTEVPAPIDGRIGRSLVTTGALVTAGQPTALTTIQRLDPIFVDLQQSSAELLALRRSLSHEGSAPASADVRLQLPDGSEYGHVGQLQFAEAVVEPSTGSVTLRARFENPDGVLLPGMYARATVGQATARDAILVPPAGVSRDPKGGATALVVGAEEKVEQRTLETDRLIADRWLIRKGLNAGDRLIVEGTDKVKPGQVVRAVPAAAQPNQVPTNQSASAAEHSTGM